MDQRSADRLHGSGVWIWIAFVVLASLGLSRAFACATPFAAIAVLAVCTLPRRHAVAQVLLAWAGNQAVGFGLMHYPHTASTMAWGVAIGAAALASFGAALMTGHLLSNRRVPGLVITLLVATGVYEAVLITASAVLPSGPGAFAPEVVLRMFGINAVALGLLIAARQLASGARAMPGARLGREAVR